jgi:5-methylthioadenosine/S-adenosylhomocysteine deaminase
MNESARGTLLIHGGRVYQHDHNTDRPEAGDVLIADGIIFAVRPGIAAALARNEPLPELGGRHLDQIIDATDKLLIPGFVNAHYHSHDVLLKGCFETIPLELWFLNALPPNYPKRSTAEIRLRTLLGAVECLRNGITTVQDFATLSPFDEEHLDAMLQAYEEVGIRCIFALQIADVPAIDSTPFWRDVIPSEYHTALSGAAGPMAGFDPKHVVHMAVASHRHRHPRITWALGPSSPERCSESLLEWIAEFSETADLPVYTHIYESKGMTLIGRQKFVRDGGSLVRYLERKNLLSKRVTLAHSVWMSPEELDAIAAAGANVVLNLAGNLKTRSGIPPIRSYLERGVNVGLGCDNCSCGDAQNMFEAMKLFTTLAAVCEPEPGPPTAADAVRCATVGGARTASSETRLGAIRPGMAADLSILDLSDSSFVPLNSAARQLVFSEAGRAVETVVVDGQIIVRHRKVTTIDEQALKDEVESTMPMLRKDLDVVVTRNGQLLPYLMEAYRRTIAVDLGVERYARGAR